jgi:hypothetical protein
MKAPALPHVVGTRTYALIFLVQKLHIIQQIPEPMPEPFRSRSSTY